MREREREGSWPNWMLKIFEKSYDYNEQNSTIDTDFRKKILRM